MAELEELDVRAVRELAGVLLVEACNGTGHLDVVDAVVDDPLTFTTLPQHRRKGAIVRLLRAADALADVIELIALGEGLSGGLLDFVVEVQVATFVDVDARCGKYLGVERTRVVPDYQLGAFCQLSEQADVVLSIPLGALGVSDEYMNFGAIGTSSNKDGDTHTRMVAPTLAVADSRFGGFAFAEDGVDDFQIETPGISRKHSYPLCWSVVEECDKRVVVQAVVFDDLIEVGLTEE